MTATDTNMYLGIPGALEIIYAPKGNLTRTRIRQVDVFGLGGGGFRVAKQLGGARRYQIDYTRLSYDTFKVLEAYEQGHNGVGPFVFLDPGQRNILTVNQSSATSERNDTNNFTLSGSGLTMASEFTQYRRGPRSLSVTFQYSGVTTGYVQCNTPAPEWYGFPVVAGRVMTLSAWIKGGGTDGVVSMNAQMSWFTAAGVANGTGVGNTVVTNNSTWQQVKTSPTPPAGTAYALPRFNFLSNVTAGDVVYLDQLMLHEGTAVDDTWSPGTGILPVSVVGLADSWPITAPTYRERPTLILQEVGNGG